MQGFGAVAVLNLAIMTGNVGGVRRNTLDRGSFTYIRYREANRSLLLVSSLCE